MPRKRIDPSVLIDSLSWLQSEGLVTERTFRSLSRAVLERCAMKRPRKAAPRKRRAGTVAAAPSGPATVGGSS